MCPYGRLQSALSDDDTMIIGYDHQRGEPRGAKGKTTGACVDCRRCVQVCPTGIDIRLGLQLECIGCAACIDACDEVMDKLGRERGLVRYDSLRGLEGQKRRWLRPRVYVYALLAGLGLIALGLVAADRVKPYFVTWSRVNGAAYFVDPAMVRNHFQYRFANKRNQPAHLQIRLGHGPTGCVLSANEHWIDVPAQSETKGTAVVMMPRALYTGPFDLSLTITAQPGDVLFEEKLRFLGPAADSPHHDSEHDDSDND
jgi:cytochrome c oxidase accessory protein FixG